jgi:methionyl aminopeptidase
MKESYKQNFIRAGALAHEVRAFGKGLIQKGASYNDVLARVERKIIELGGIPAFPPQIALNEVAAHFLTEPGSDILFSNELVKLDIGVCFEGAVGDCAVTVDLSGKHQPLIDAAEAALLAAEKIIKVGLPIREIGRAIEQTILSFGLQPVRNLCGHGLGLYRVHTPPLIPNYHDQSKGCVQPGMTFAIEPFATNGKGMIHEQGASTLFSLLKNKTAPTPLAERLIARMQQFHGLPFSLHNLLEGELSAATVRRELHPLIVAGIVGSYPPLVEETQGFVAQAENSVLVDAKGHILITTR